MDGGQEPRGNFAPVALTGRRPPVERWLAIVLVALVLAVSKPWASPDGTGGPGDGAGGPAKPAAQETATATPSSSNSRDAGPLVADFCLETASWLVASVERSHGQRFRVWQTIEPASEVAGPDDPAIPLAPVVAEGVTEVGWCAPVVADERRGAHVQVAAWLRSTKGAVPIVMETSRPAVDRSPFGDLYRPPGASPTSGLASWPSGTYVFRFREDDGSERWLGIEVEIRPVPGPRPAP